MTTDHKTVLHDYLLAGREALLWKLDGLDEYDVRRPLTPTGTNLLGLVKHVALTAAGYFGDVFDRPFAEAAPYYTDETEDNADMWAPAHESRDDVLGLWTRAWEHSDATIAALDLDAPGHVPWWGPARADVNLGQIMAHMIAELHRHAGHADIVRESIDGAAGLRDGNSNLPPADWPAHVARLEASAREAAGR